jgi:hypothetical protein
MNRINIEPYTPPEMTDYPGNAPILIAGIVVIALIPVVFAYLIWGQA